MGTDNLFHKRKAASARDLQRRKAKREPYAKVLIVCEGSKTEPLYFDSLKNHYRLSSANIEITGESDSSPDKVWEFAKQRYRQEQERGDAFDKVYCVFDRDTHSAFEATCEAIKAAEPADTFMAITSEPCFEYWLLLHFTYTTQSFHASPEQSAAKQVLKTLQNYWPDYAKGQSDVFQHVLESLEFAKNNAARALKEAERNQHYNPSTYVHELVSFLQDLKKS